MLDYFQPGCNEKLFAINLTDTVNLLINVYLENFIQIIHAFIINLHA